MPGRKRPFCIAPLKTFQTNNGMVNVERASFLNLDPELESGEDLTPLATHLGVTAYVLYNDKFGDKYRLIAEPLINGHLNPNHQQCTEAFLETLNALPKDLEMLFLNCHSRTFDYGFDGGHEAPPLFVTLTADQLSRTARLGIDLRVTVYPYRAAND